MRALLVFLTALALASCAKNEVIMPLAVEDSRFADVEKIHVATLRAPSAQALSVFSGDRSDGLNFAEMNVSIPKNREPGTIVYPRAVANVKEQFASTGYVTNKSEEQFVASIRAELAKKPADERVLFVFVHGYNTNFASGVFRQAQMFKDFKFSGVAVNFSWASAGKTGLYLYDRDSAQLARSGLRRTLQLLAKTNATNITLVGHSMGAFVTMETLREIGIRKETHLLKRIDTLILASPDIDQRVFRDQLSNINPLPQPFVIFVSKNDRALQASEALRGGNARVGKGENIEELREAGITVIDLSNLSDGQDATNHTTFATSQTLFKMTESGAFSRDALLGARKPDTALKPIGDGLGAVTDLAAAIIYLPAKVVGVR
ncbi:alpha/beta hydrolase [Pseudahrensia aquimaris]|uniref:Alpha/beta hydrolase n=1 Tax=Pseudahrensia aquimaris TaxID=744461 RepID=A0ABW3FHD3_9HYPH